MLQYPLGVTFLDSECSDRLERDLHKGLLKCDCLSLCKLVFYTITFIQTYSKNVLILPDYLI